MTQGLALKVFEFSVVKKNLTFNVHELICKEDLLYYGFHCFEINKITFGRACFCCCPPGLDTVS